MVSLSRPSVEVSRPPRRRGEEPETDSKSPIPMVEVLMPPRRHGEVIPTEGGARAEASRFQCHPAGMASVSAEAGGMSGRRGFNATPQARKVAHPLHENADFTGVEVSMPPREQKESFRIPASGMPNCRSFNATPQARRTRPAAGDSTWNSGRSFDATPQAGIDGKGEVEATRPLRGHRESVETRPPYGVGRRSYYAASQARRGRRVVDCGGLRRSYYAASQARRASMKSLKGNWGPVEVSRPLRRHGEAIRACRYRRSFNATPRARRARTSIPPRSFGSRRSFNATPQA